MFQEPVAVSGKCSQNSSGWDCLVVTHREFVLRALFLFLELRTFRGSTIGMPGRSAPAEGAVPTRGAGWRPARRARRG
eukprot:1038878-Pyramimonas_sp.AAC.1